MYVSVPWEESLRKNKKRYNPAKPDSILEHALSDEKLEKLYREDDWLDLAQSDIGFIEIQNTRVPFVVFNNEDDFTTLPGRIFSIRLKKCLDELWYLYNC